MWGNVTLCGVMTVSGGAPEVAIAPLMGQTAIAIAIADENVMTIRNRNIGLTFHRDAFGRVPHNKKVSPVQQ
jgi:hypothetical protein